VSGGDAEFVGEVTKLRQALNASKRRNDLFRWAFLAEVALSFVVAYFHQDGVFALLWLVAAFTFVGGVVAFSDYRRSYKDYWQSTGLSTSEASSKFNKLHPPVMD
jgi:hypothetical protein